MSTPLDFRAVKPKLKKESKMKKSILAVALLAASTQASANFEVVSYVDELAAERRYAIIAESKGRDDMRVAATCAGERAIIYTSHGKYTSGGRTDVSYRFDDGEVRTEEWRVMGSNMAAISDSDAIEFAKRIIDSDGFVVRVSTYSGSVTGVYSSRGLAGNLHKLKCFGG